MPNYDETYINVDNQEVLARAAAAKEKYAQTGDLSSIQEDIRLIASETGYSETEVRRSLMDISSSDSWIEILNKVGDELNALGLTSSVATRAKNLFNSLTNIITNGETLTWRDSIMGLPFRFNAYTDPRNRIFVDTYLSDLQIITFDVGNPKFRGTDPDLSGLESVFGKDATESSWFKGAKGFGVDDEDAIPMAWLMESQKSMFLNTNKDLRYYSFERDFTAYTKYLGILTNTVGTKMGINLEATNLMEYFTTKNIILSKGLKFCCKKDISVNESMSNDYKDSVLAGKTKEISDAAREVQFLTGKTAQEMGLSSSLSGIFDVGGSALSGITSIFGDNAVSNTISNVAEGASAAVSGINLFYPQIWSDSSFSRSYNVNFSFITPYGDPDSIFRYVYMPFLMLVAMSFPKQFMGNGYSAPFLLRVDVPGLFTSDLAVITSISWTKGGGEGLWSKDGLPLAIDVSLSIKDLYPIFPIPGNWVMLRHNTGMHGFLDNLAGLATGRLAPFDNWSDSIRARFEYFKGQARTAIPTWLSDAFMSHIYASNGY